MKRRLGIALILLAALMVASCESAQNLAFWRKGEKKASGPVFEPIGQHELAELEVEISVLSPLRPVSGPLEIVVGRDGLVVERGGFRGLLLPQVGERYSWTAEEFLDQTCRKAGMRPGCWRDPETKISTFSAEVFSETDVEEEPTK